ncbi:MAG: DNA lyase [Candidatus Omnitrophica bacterium]|nr:DNA lyase [Candidatus Omnitrophota bacterium]
MRLWSLHPLYLDSKGLVALWRESLLAQKVLMGKTKGYKNHPQLERFKEHKNPQAAIGYYLMKVYEEAYCRGYNFDETKIITKPKRLSPIKVTKGQVNFERIHLFSKLLKRASEQAISFQQFKRLRLHPLFKLMPGPVAKWEKGK